MLILKNIFLTKTLIAHRGYHNIKSGIPENSMLAFKRAVRYRYIIELDVHILKDGNIVVFHDYNLKRVCKKDKIIENCTYKDIKDLTLFETKERIPLLKDVLKFVNGKVPILIEIKSLAKTNILEEKLATLLDKYDGLFAIQSFNIFSIYWFKKNRPKFIRGLLLSSIMENSFRKVISKTLILDIFLKTNFLAYDIKALPSKYASIIRSKKPIIGWVIKNKKEYLFAKKYCDAFICENMDKFKKLD